MGLTEPSPNKKLKTYNSYLKYSSLGLQLLAAIGVFGWLGYKLDQYLNLNVGPATLAGHIGPVDSLITIESFLEWLHTRNPSDLVFFNLSPIEFLSLI